MLNIQLPLDKNHMFHYNILNINNSHQDTKARRTLFVADIKNTYTPKRVVQLAKNAD